MKPVGNNIDSNSKICLVGKAGIDIKNPKNIIATEYADSSEYLSNFSVLKQYGIVGKFLHVSGCAESYVCNGMADLAIVIVETGNTLIQNNLIIHKTICTLNTNCWVNCDNPIGYYFLSKYRKITEVFIDGIDGSGKDTVINILKSKSEYKNFVFRNRGELTKLTLDPEEKWNKNIEGIHIILDCSPQIAKQRIQTRNQQKNNNDPYETIGSLSYFRYRYKSLAGKYGLCVIDNEKDVNNTIINIGNYLLNGNNENVYPQVDVINNDYFNSLPLIAQGESKIIRSINSNFDIIKYIPSIYSHTKRRAGFIENSEKARISSTRQVLRLLAYEQIPHTYIYIGKEYILAEKLKNPPPKIEIICKSSFVRTDAKRYVGLDQLVSLNQNKEYIKPYIRFDWRNENSHPEGDVAISESLVENLGLIHVDNTKNLALYTFIKLREHFSKFNVNIVDLCLFITKEGNKIFGEISPDNGRFKKVDDTKDPDYDKDVWRRGGSHENVLEKWMKLTELIQTYCNSFFHDKYKEISYEQYFDLQSFINMEIILTIDGKF